MNDLTCGKCGKVMTQANSTIAPEFFLCNSCVSKPVMTHPELVRALVKSGARILAEMTGSDAHLLHMAVGVSGEAGELLDAIKKCVIYRKSLDRANVIEELGDLEFYMQAIRDELHISREETIEHNILKLSMRYNGGQYSNASAQERADKK